MPERFEDRTLLSLTLTTFDDSPFAVGAIPFDLVAADFDGDGIPDLATANANSDDVTVLLADGEGGFSEAAGSPIPAGDGAQGILAADLDGDLIIDLAVANANEDTVSIFIGRGDGRFLEVPGSPFAVGDSPRKVAAGTFDAGSTVDLAVVNATSNDVTILLGDGNGAFAEATGSPIAVGNDPRDVVAGDFDGDDEVDLATVDSDDDTVTVLLGDGDGTFTEATGSPIAVGDAPTALSTADLDGDETLDLAVANFLDEDVTVLLGDGDGTFTEATGSPVAVDGRPADVIAEDLDGDGVPDLVTANRFFNNDLSILLGDGDGTFTAAAISPVEAGTQPVALAVGDFDDDGVRDLAVTNTLSDDVSVFRNVPLVATIEDVMVPEGDEGTSNATFTVTLSATPSTPVTIDYEILPPPTLDPMPPEAPAPATPGEDYTPVTGTLTFNGTDTATITVPILGDLELEPNEVFTVVLSNPLGCPVVLPMPAVGTILNDDAEVTLVDVAAPEGDAGTSPATFTVTIPFPSTNPVSVDYATTAMMGSATAGTDYTPASGTVTIAPGMTSATFTVGILGDQLVESDETFAVMLSNPTNASIAEMSDMAIGTIQDDESTIMLGSDSITVEEGEDAFLTVIRTGMGALNRPSSVVLTVGPGTMGSATPGEDYSPITMTLTFAPFETIKQLSIHVVDDDLIEPAETFTASIGEFMGADPGMPSTATVTIAASSARFLPVMPDPRRSPVPSVDVEFSEPIEPSSFTTSDLSMVRDGAPVTLPAVVTISEVMGADRPTYRISGLGGVTGTPGNYTLSLNYSGITDGSGNPGTGSPSESFTVRGGTPLGDYDGDGAVDLAVYQYDQASGTGRFFVERSSRMGQADQRRVFDLGTSSAIPLAGDFDGDGITDPAVADPQAVIGEGTIPNATVWTYLSSMMNYTPVVVPFGGPGILDRPAPADYDGDGITDIATLRPESDLTPGAAEWFIRPSSNINDGFRVVFGAAGGADLPVPADYDGDGVDDIASYRPDSDIVPGAAQWFVLPSRPNLPRYANRLNGFPVTFGDAGDLAVQADYNGDGRIDVGVFRPNSNLGQLSSQWFTLPSQGASPGFGPAFPTTFGPGGSIAAPGDYDRDTLADLAVFNQSTGTWTIRQSTSPEGAPPRVFNSSAPTGPGAIPVLSPLISRLAATNNLPGSQASSVPRAATAARTAGTPSTRSLVALATFDSGPSASPTAPGPEARDDPRGVLVDAALDDLGRPGPLGG